MKRLIFSISFILLPFLSFSQTGKWHIYSAYHDATKVVELGGVIYVLSDGNLYSYDPDDSNLETYDKTEALNDFDIFDILDCQQTKELVIVYKNGNIDLLDQDGNVFNMSEFKTKTLSDKTINDVVIEGQTLYICCNSGIVCVNISDHSFGDFYNFGLQVRSVALLDGYIIAGTNKGPYRGERSSNLLDPSSWVRAKGYTGFRKYRMLDGVIYCLWPDGIYYITNNETVTQDRVLNDKTTNLWECNGKMYACTSEGKLYEITSPKDYREIDNTYKINHFIYSGSTYWGACGVNGLMGLSLSDGVFAEKVASVIPNSPIRDHAYRLNMVGDDRLLVAGGVFNFSGVTQRRATVMKLEGGKWTTFDETPYDEFGDLLYRNSTDIVQDPSNPEHHYVGTAQSGIYEFQDYKYVSHYSYDNTPLTTILPNDANPGAFVRITGLAFDSKRNLWMCNNQCDTIIRIMKADKSWTSYHVPEVSGFPTFDHIVFDERGWAWINSRRSGGGGVKAGFLVVNPGSDPGKPSGFSHKFVNTFYNQDGTSYLPILSTGICFDLDGALWLGNDKGLFMHPNPQEIMETKGNNVVLTQVKVPRNDGTDLADYLLSEVPVKCITVDGGNRKWIGTSGMGVYLISSDGLETIHHFTSGNSPLISDDIYDIKVNGSTGEVYFATIDGLCSYVADATDPVEKLDDDLVKVYPNPVRPEHQGNIVVRGLKRDSNVKIVNAAGRLVHEGTSVGGSFTWNGRIGTGKRAASGIYYILATDESGKNGVVGKFLMVKE